MARAAKGAKASLLVISAQNFIATATATQRLPEMTAVIWNATMELQDLEMGFNLYQMDLSLAANLTFALAFAFVLLCHIFIGAWRKHVYFTVCMSLGVGLEVAGYVARILSIGHYLDKGTFLCQIISLTLAPAFVMAGVYFLLAQLLVVHGRKFSVLSPLWFSYIFIFCDFASLAIQAGGGGTAAIKLQNLESTTTGTHVMVVGIAFQVLSMTLFLYLLFDFLFRIYFRASPEVKFSIPNLFRLLLNTGRGKDITHTYLETNYNQKYQHIWSRKMFGFYPLVLFLSVFFIYVRCVYRLVELSEGWTGYLITHEQYVMTLDGMMVLITCILLVPFHPGFIMGANTNISMKQIKNGEDLEMSSSPRHLIDSNFSDNSNPFYGEDEKYDQMRYHERQVSATSLEASSPEQIAKESFTPPVRSSTRFESPVIDDGGLVAIPYEFTSTRNSFVEVPKTTKTTPRPPKRAHHKTHSTASTPSINPYERNSTLDKLATYGPYEQFSGRLEEVNPFEDPRHDFSDMQSQVTHDEFLFTFDK